VEEGDAKTLPPFNVTMYRRSECDCPAKDESQEPDTNHNLNTNNGAGQCGYWGDIAVADRAQRYRAEVKGIEV